MQKSFRVKIKPTEEQEKKFRHTWEGYKEAYNWAVEQQIRFFDAENLRRETAEDTQYPFIKEYTLSGQWTQYKKELKKETNRPKYEPIRKERLERVTGVCARTLTTAFKAVCACCDRFFKNAKGKPAIRPHSKWNKRFCSPDSKNAPVPYLFINKDKQPVFSLYYRTGGPHFLRNSSPISFPVTLQNIRVTARHVYISQLSTYPEHRGIQDKIQLLERGRIPFSHDNPLKYSNPRISFDGVDWWLSIGVQLPDMEYPVNEGLSIGVDMGVSNKAIATLDTGQICSNHVNKDYYKRALDTYTRLQKALDKKRARIKKLNNGEFVPSASFDKLKRRVAKARIKLQNVKEHSRHQASYDIIKLRPSLIGLEDLDINAMISTEAQTEDKTKKEWKRWHRRILATGMYEVQRQIEYKAKWRGIKVQKVTAAYTSKTCSNCGFVNKDITLKNTEWTCPNCGAYHANRDVNAAINIRNRAEQEVKK